jgi:hypothetical protein
MKRKSSIYCSLIFILLLASCSQYYRMQLLSSNINLLSIKKGMPSNEIDSLIQENNDTKLIIINKKNVFEIPIEKEKPEKYEVIIEKRILPIGLRFYIYAFNNNKLFYWGTPLEFARNESAIFNEIGIESAKLIEKYKESEKSIEDDLE